MSVPPEGQLLIINAAILGVAYFGIYPSMRDITPAKMALEHFEEKCEAVFR